LSALPAFALLLLSAVLEVSGDALVRRGLHGAAGQSLATRAVLLALGGLVLFSYGLAVNLPPWDFGRLLGIYVVLFFLVAQLVNVVVFGARPGFPVLLAGALIALGGLILTLWAD
jgi:small multidrug resistance family-3 protein